MGLSIRPEQAGDESSITNITLAAFSNVAHSSQTEHHIVNALRDAGQLTISLVAELDGDIVGHLAISPVSISDGSPGWFGLGPISVSPDFEGQGVGSRLMRKVLSILEDQGAAGCVLLGDPQYYGRFGFKAEPTLVLPGVPESYFQTLRFGGNLPSGEVTYHPAFFS